MTRIVRVRRILCERCEKAGSKDYCLDCGIPMCDDCCENDPIHNGGTTTHRMVQAMQFLSGLAFCDMCDWRPGAVYCEAEGSVLCVKCDTFLHSGRLGKSHLRKPITTTITERPVSLVYDSSDSESESVHDGSVVEPPTSPPSSPVVEPPTPIDEDVIMPLQPDMIEPNAKKRQETKKKRQHAEEVGSGSGGNNNGSDEQFDPASSKGASGDGVTNNGSNENASNGSNGDEGTSSMERASIDASADARLHKSNPKDSSRDSCSSGAVSGNGKPSDRVVQKASKQPRLEKPHSKDQVAVMRNELAAVNSAETTPESSDKGLD